MKNNIYSLQWANSEASKCLYCYDAPCVQACPTSLNIPLFIRFIRFGDILGAKKEIKSENCLGGICAYLCPATKLCEKACLLQKISEPVKISKLQQFACDNADFSLELGSEHANKKIAIIGAGPAGLSCAVGLIGYGYQIDIYEKEEFVGGTVVKEIPDFKIPEEAIQKDIDELSLDKCEGINFYFKEEIDKDKLTELPNKYDAVYLSLGLKDEMNLDLEKNINHYTASQYLSLVKKKEIEDFKGTCIVIGGGDTAIDAARSVLKLGADRSIIAYRRSKKEMPANEEEIIKATKEGVEFLFCVSPISFKNKNSSVEVGFVRNVLVETDSSGRKAFRKVPGSEFNISADQIIFALGKKNYKDIWEGLFGKIDSNGRQKTLQLSDSNIFAGGDFLNDGKTVVEAVANGKKAAVLIHEYLENN